MFSIVQIICAIISIVPLAFGHFQLNYPQSRGYVFANETYFCGGFSSPKPRVPFPIYGGFYIINSEHPRANIMATLSFNPNPTSYQQFNISPSGQTIPPLTPFTTLVGQGTICLPVDIAGLGIPDLQGDTNATIQVQYNGGDGTVTQCADVTLQNTTVTSSVACQNSTATTN
ncbi:hypothetical protein BOTBODRAFT_125906, partial [Botryobasidium botryosum FD-172 SS1]